jgi:fatty-acyl-CoA synthase
MMGAVLHTLNLRLFPDQLEYVIRDAADRFVVVDASLLPVLDKLAGKLPAVERIVAMSDSDGADVPRHNLGDLLDYERLLAEADERFAWPELDERAAAAMCYTSGTTGNPKGVVYTHRSQFLHAMGALQVSSGAIAESDIIQPSVPMFHANCWALPYAAGLAGASLVFLDRWSGDGQAIADMAEAEGSTVLAGVPTIGLSLLNTLRESGRRLPSVRSMLMGGSAVPEALMRGLDELGIPILHAWGMTETSPICTTARPSRHHTTDAQRLQARLTQGAIQPGVELRIVDLASGEELAWDGRAFGEVQVRGPWIASGYHHNPDPERITPDGWLRTGDVATISPEGYIRLVDRTKDLIKSGGEWISSVDMEGDIMAMAEVAEAVVVAIPDARWQERPLACIVPRAGADVTLEAVHDHLTARGWARWQLPDRIEILEAIPRTGVGKFDKKVLRAQFAEAPVGAEAASGAG